ncbi:hypothetical protein JCM10212_001345 [Sporobolomyces blumeae]
MSYASAASHAPTSVDDPHPDPALLESNQPANQPEHHAHVKHVKVAPSAPTNPQTSTAAGTGTGTGTGTGGGTGGGGASSKNKKKKKKAKGKKDGHAAAGDDQDEAATRPGQPDSGPESSSSSPTETLKEFTSEKAVSKDDEGKEDEKGVESTVPAKREGEADVDGTAGHDEHAKKSKVNGADQGENETESTETAPREVASKDAESASSTASDSASSDDEGGRKSATNKVPNSSKSSSDAPPGSGFATEIANHPSMSDRPTLPKDLANKIVDPFVARANIAASVESPDGTTTGDYAEKHRHESVLQQHVAFFDRDGDGVIWPHDTFIGFYRLGYAVIWCILSVFLIHPTFSFFTQKSWIPDPFFRIRTDRIHRAKHGSDTSTYDAQGRFVPAKFEAIFEKFDRGHKGGLTFSEGLAMIRSNRNVMDPVGWIGAFFEWFASYLLIWPKDGVVSKEDLRTIYDGSIFFAIADKLESNPSTARRFPLSGNFQHNGAHDVARLDKKRQ